MEIKILPTVSLKVITLFMEVVSSTLQPHHHQLSLSYAPLLVTWETTEEKLIVILLATLVHGCLKDPAKSKEKSINLPLLLAIRLRLVTKESTVTLPSVDTDK